ncbi:MAG: LPS export ABC transporter permease LptF [Colwellia sp.]
MIIFHYLLKEVAKTQLAVFLILMTIFISQKFVRVLGDASEGGIPGQLVMTFIVLKIPDLAGFILPLSLFLGVLLAYGRIYADSEMTVLHACGVSEWYVVRVTLVLAVITAILTGIFTLYLAPLAAEYQDQVKEQLAADSGLSALVPGRFQKTGNQDAVVFIHDKDRENNHFNKVFVAQLPKGNYPETSILNYSLVYAKTGRVFEDEHGSQQLVLGDGIRYHRDIKSGDLQSVAFDKYYIQIKDQEIERRHRKLSALPTLELFSDIPPNLSSAYSATIQWRIAFPLLCLILIFIAVPLSVVNPRQGKFGKLFPALMLFLSYLLLLTSMKSAIEKNAIPSVIGLWPVHAGALFIGFMLLMKERSSGRFIKAKLPSFKRKSAHKVNQAKES